MAQAAFLPSGDFPEVVDKSRLQAKNQPKVGRKTSISADFWSEWRGSNSRPPHPKCGALSTALHPDSLFNCGRVGGQICGQTHFWPLFFVFQTARNPHGWRAFCGFRFRAVRTPSMLPSRRATNCATPGYIWFFYFVIFAKHSITIRCASLKNIVALLAWSASHCSLFFHLRASPESSAGRGEPLRPTALHPDIFDFLLCYFCETQHNSPLFARKCTEFRLNA